MRLLMSSFLVLWTLLFSASSSGVAFCALRDPVSAIQHFYPDYTSYKAMDGSVNESVRAVLDEQLPGVHFSEFGTHTLYVVFRDLQVVGYVHARTEKGEWGLDELIWALSPDLQIADFRYQRSRSQGRKLVESPEFLDWLSGRNLEGVVSLLTPEGDHLQERPEFIPSNYEDTVVSVVRSAVKTLVITDHVWPAQVNQQSE